MQAVESNVSRRRLLGSALTLGAGAAIGSTVSFPSAGAALAAAGRQDLVHEELIRQIELHSPGDIYNGDAVEKTVARPDIRQKMESLGLEILPPEQRTPTYMAKFLPQDIERWGKVIKAAGIHVD